MPKELRSISDITPDAKNANLGTERGRYLLEQSFRELGAGRSVVTDAEGRMIGGNKTLEIAEELKLPIEVIRTDGSTLVVVQRTDLDLSDDHGKARQLAYFDNRTSEIGLAWSAEQIVADLDTGVDLEGMFRDGELAALVGGLLEVDYSHRDVSANKRTVPGKGTTIVSIGPFAAAVPLEMAQRAEEAIRARYGDDPEVALAELCDWICADAS